MTFSASESSILPYRLQPEKISIKEGELGFMHAVGEMPYLVLLPGSFSEASQYFSLLQYFPANYSILIVEYRGHGQSWPPLQHGSIESLTKDVILILDHLKISQFFVAGHSIGGMIALEMGRILSHRVLGIVSIEGWTNHYAQRDAYNRVNDSTLTPDQEKERITSREKVIARWTKIQIDTFGKIWKKWDGSRFLRNSLLPILEIYGDRGKKIPPTRKALHIPDRTNIQFVIIPNGSHSLPLQFPKALAELILGFMQQNGKKFLGTAF